MRFLAKVSLATALLAAASGAGAATISIRADVWCPFNCEPGPLPGYMIELAKLALEPAGHTIDYANLNWARAIAETRQGAFSGIVGAAKTDAPDFVFPAVAVGFAQQCFFTKPDAKWTFTTVAALPAGAVGVIKDYSYGSEFDDYVKANAKNPKKVDVVSGDNPLELNLKKLEAGRIVAFVEEASVVKNYFFKKKQPLGVREAGCITNIDPDLFVAFGPKTKDGAAYAKLIAAKIEAMRADGSLKTLLAKYGLEDWKK